MATLTAGNFSGTEGYFAGSAGSLSPNTFGGLTCTAILTGITAGRVSVIFAGNAVSFLTGKTITIEGVPYSTIASGPTYDGSSQTNIEWAYGGGDFIVGNVYTVDIGTGAPVDPNITSASTVSNDLGSSLSHSLTADKTITTWEIIGGADAAEFEISGSTLRFAGNVVSDTLGDFVVQVRATDTDGLTDEQTITVSVVVPYTGPTWIGKSTAASSASAFNISFASSGRASGDRLFIAVMTANEAISAPSGFTEVATYSPQSRGTAAVAGGVRLTLFEKESVGTEGTVSIADSGNIQYAVGFVVRGDGGVEINTGAGNNVAATTSGSFGGVTTSVDGCLIVHVVATDRDSTAQSWSGVANTNLRNLTEQHDAGTTTNTGGGIAIFTGELPTAGATGDTTATQAASSAFCWITLALKNVASDSPVTGSLAATESSSPDTFALTGDVEVHGTLSSTESSEPDSCSMAGTVYYPAITGSLSSTEDSGGDIPLASGSILISGQMDLVEESSLDTADFDFLVPVSASLVAEELTDPDSALLQGQVLVFGEVQSQESSNEDSFQASGTILDPEITGSLEVTESSDPDTWNQTGLVLIDGSVESQEEDLADTSEIIVGVEVTGNLIVSEPDTLDQSQIVGTVAWPARIGTFEAIEDSSEDIASGQATVPVQATLSSSETGSDLFQATGLVNYTGISGSLSITEPDTPDIYEQTGSVTITSQINAQESGTDSADMSGAVEILATLDSTDSLSLDSASALGSVSWPNIEASLNVTESVAPDEASFNADLLITGFFTSDESDTPDEASIVGITPLESILVMDAQESSDPDTLTLSANVIVTALLNITEIGDDHFFAGVIHATSFSQRQSRATASLPQIRHTESESELMGSVSNAQVRATESEPQNRHTVSLPQPRETS